MRKSFLLLIIVLLALTLAACGDDDKKDEPPAATPTEAGGLGPVGPALNVNSGAEATSSTPGRLPGCSDPNSDECPAPLEMTLDGEISVGGVTVKYPARYFVAAEGGADGPLVEISPSENNKFDEKATFSVSFADSIDAALAGLTDPETGAWSNATLNGTIGVSKNQAQDPPMNTTIGAFTTPDGRVIVVQVITTGKYGWDLWSRVYEEMLNALVIE
jgi:hypothetical protein